MSESSLSSFEKLLNFLELLKRENIYYKMDSVRDAIMVEVAVPGERWEVESFANGDVEFERFISQGTIEDETFLNEYIKQFLDKNYESQQKDNL